MGFFLIIFLVLFFVMAYSPAHSEFSKEFPRDSKIEFDEGEQFENQTVTFFGQSQDRGMCSIGINETGIYFGWTGFSMFLRSDTFLPWSKVEKVEEVEGAIATRECVNVYPKKCKALVPCISVYGEPAKIILEKAKARDLFFRG